MDIAACIAWKYPTAKPGVDYKIKVGQLGGQYIGFWRFGGGPQPSDADLQSWWLPCLREQKIKSFSTNCNQTILSGFTSSALGTPHTYESDEETQRNRLVTMLMLTHDSSIIDSISEKTLEQGHVEHTQEQFKQLFKDQHEHIKGNRAKYRKLKNQVLEATTEEQIGVIAW